MRCGFLIPFRDRNEHLLAIAPILNKYGKVYVIDQCDEKSFNFGKTY